jgi:hypothetical protein
MAQFFSFVAGKQIVCCSATRPLYFVHGHGFKPFFSEGGFMDFKTQYPDFASVEEHIRRARVERSVAVAHAFVTLWKAAERGFGRLARSVAQGLDAERDRRAIEADAFVRRWVPKP